MPEENTNTPVIASQMQDGTVILTGEEAVSAYFDRLLAAYDPDEHAATAYLHLDQTTADLDQETVDSCAEDAQTNIDSALKINRLIKKYINSDNIIGLVVQSISNNINTDYRLVYDNIAQDKIRPTILKRAQRVINDFNKQIDVENLISEAIIETFCGGSYISLLQKAKSNWTISNLPLGVAEISGYMYNGRPVVLINIDQLKSALSKTMIKNGRNYLFYANTEAEINACYPKEVYDAYKNRYKYAKLDPAYTGVVRVNNYGCKYGLSPIFRSLSPMIALRTFQDADVACAKATGKKIVHQVLRKELLGPTGDRSGIVHAKAAHKALVEAWQNNTVVYTSAPTVEKIVYVEPTATSQSSKINEYRNMVLTSLGISFLANNDGKLTAASANISIQQLMRQINAISRSVEKMLENFYETVLVDAGIDITYRPSIKIIDSEMLSMDLRIDLAKTLYNVLGASRDTAFSTLGLNLDDERAKRESENEANLSDVFTPYPTSYVLSGDDQGGRPASSDDANKQQEDKARNNGDA